MKHGLGGMLAALCAFAGMGFVTGGSVDASSEPAGRSTEDEVMEVVRSFNEAFADNDPDRYFKHIHPDVVVLTPANPYRVEGVVDDREEFEWGLRTERTKVGYFQEIQPLVRIHGDVAVVTYYSRGSYGPEQAVAYLKETDVLVRGEEGWKIVHIHVSGTSR